MYWKILKLKYCKIISSVIVTSHTYSLFNVFAGFSLNTFQLL